MAWGGASVGKQRDEGTKAVEDAENLGWPPSALAQLSLSPH